MRIYESAGSQGGKKGAIKGDEDHADEQCDFSASVFTIEDVGEISTLDLLFLGNKDDIIPATSALKGEMLEQMDL